MNQDLRNALRRNVQALRELLVESAERQLEGTFGILPDGTIQPPESVPPLQASPELRRHRDEIVAAIEHEIVNLSGKGKERRAIRKFALEAAFTLLNRFAALKLMERRSLVPECLAKGENSEGFELFQKIAPVLIRAQPDNGYRLFLDLLFDDVANEVRLVFDRTLPTSNFFPDPSDLRRVLDLLNNPAIAPAWDEDEALGWVYQYFTPKELRDQVRKESNAPRNSYELAIRNQFYTPDYVVRFLAENTLGRLWWEMNPGTSIKERDYLVYRPDEQPEERDPKDPRELHILDPACGSGHFLHYCFDLLQTIYREAYERHSAGDGLRTDYPDVEDFERSVPGLILYHNLYGIDIDLRATQLTAVSLYMRAKRAHSEAEIRRVNAVHAAPMPGEESLFEEFLGTLDGEPHAELIKILLRRIWDELSELAGEAGSLLRPEVGIRARIEDMKEKIETQRGEGGQLGLGDWVGPEYEQAELPITTVPTQEFWEGLEARLLEFLRRYAERTEGDGIARRLFAEDAVHGIGFLDALMRKYDVVLMNPPFGAASKPSKSYIDDNYPRTKNDVYAAFVERGLELLHMNGHLGAITSRTGFFLSSFQKWREEILLEETDIIAFADLGHGVLDTAMVETAAYALEKMA